MQNSKIEWTNNTFNPWWGCTNISPACDHCYAEMMATVRAQMFAKIWEIEIAGTIWGKDAPRLIIPTMAHWMEPLAWNRRAKRTGIRERVFCASMCDVMERNEYVGSYVPGHVHSDRFFFRPDELTLTHAREALWKLIEATPDLDWLLLTKRPQEYSKFLPKTWLKDPRPNVWLMTTCESQEFVWRIKEILKVPAVVHGVSLEPLVGPVALPEELLTLKNGAWVITGGESGRKSRPSQPDWFRNLRDQCVAAGVPFHFKQWGEYGVDLVKIGKRAAGRVLDGREWDELPLGGGYDFARGQGDEL